MKKKVESQEVETRGKIVTYNQGFHSKMIEIISHAVSKYYKGDSCLVLGPSEGGEQEKDLKSYFNKVTCVDGSSVVLDKLKSKLPEYTYIHSLFEDLIINERYDTILMMHILEHVNNPIALLKKAKSRLSKDGIIIVSVPNANSIHRILGVEMGLLKDTHELNESDIRVGHRRVYDFATLKKDIIDAGLGIIVMKGIFFKLLNNKELEKFSEEQIIGLTKLGERFSEYCAEIICICKKV
jgi:SAM-dependent methyltransferase